MQPGSFALNQAHVYCPLPKADHVVLSAHAGDVAGGAGDEAAGDAGAEPDSGLGGAGGDGQRPQIAGQLAWIVELKL